MRKHYALTVLIAVVLVECGVHAIHAEPTRKPNDARRYMHDPVERDNDYPAALATLPIPSHGVNLIGMIYQAVGKGPHQTVVLLYGYPGMEKNLDLAQAIRRDGWNVVFFHYRGAWGSLGTFSFLNAEADVSATIKFLTKPAIAAQYRIDPNRLVLVGHSMGGHMAMAGLLDNPAVRCAADLEGVNLGLYKARFAKNPEARAGWTSDDGLTMLAGWSGTKAVAELEANSERLDYNRRLNALRDRPILFVLGGTERSINPEEQLQPTLDALRARHAENYRIVVLGDDHPFSATRLKLTDTVINFLDGSCATAMQHHKQ